MPCGPGCGANVRHTPAPSTHASSANTAHPAAALHCAATMALADRPVSAMPSPGPQNTSPPTAGARSCARRAMHQLTVPRNTSALVMPASSRSAGQPAGQGSARPAVSSAVATSPARTSQAFSVVMSRPLPRRRSSHGKAMYSSAPAR